MLKLNRENVLAELEKINIEENLKFSEDKYFEDYIPNIEGIAYDLADWSNDNYRTENNRKFPIFEHLSINQYMAEAIEMELLTLPIYRGYVEIEDNKVYLDKYKYNDKIYTEKELCEALEDVNFHLDAMYLVGENSFTERQDYSTYTVTEPIYDSETFVLDISGLFYYKNGPDGKYSPCIEEKEFTEKLEDAVSLYDKINKDEEVLEDDFAESLLEPLDTDLERD